MQKLGNYEYRKNNDRYQNEVKLYYQVVNKILLIEKVLVFPGYLLFFLFDNMTSHLVYAKDIL